MRWRVHGSKQEDSSAAMASGNMSKFTSFNRMISASTSVKGCFASAGSISSAEGDVTFWSITAMDKLRDKVVCWFVDGID